MKRLRSTLKWACSAGFVVSAALLVASCLTIGVSREAPGGHITIGRGSLLYSHSTTLADYIKDRRNATNTWWVRNPTAEWQLLPAYYSGTFFRMYIPLWFPTALLLMPAGALWAIDVRARRAPGLCRGCGYALTGLNPGSPCPECGAKS